MFIPFLAAATVATAFAQLGAMSVQISILTLALKPVSIALLAAALSTIVQFIRSRHRSVQ